MYKQHYLVAAFMGVGLISSAHAEQMPLSMESQTSHLTKVSNPDQDHTSSLDIEFNNNPRMPDFEQVISADDGETRVNVAMNLALPKNDELSLQVGALSLEFPEESDSPIEVDVRPFFYVGIGKNW